MKRLVLFVAVAVSALMSCGKNGGGGDDVDQTEKGVLMSDGIIWATRNVGEPGKFVANPEDYGGYFTYEEAQNVCPKGWRLPKISDFETLTSYDYSEWIDQNGIAGRRFDSIDNEESIFMPAAGRLSSGGSAVELGLLGQYWSSEGGYYGEYFFFFEDYISIGGQNGQSPRISVRCVSEEQGEL